jgi:hypothetical protein
MQVVFSELSKAWFDLSILEDRLQGDNRDDCRKAKRLLRNIYCREMNAAKVAPQNGDAQHG